VAKKRKKKKATRKHGSSGSNLTVAAYDIVYEPVETDHNQGRLDPETEAEIEELYYLCRKDPRAAAPRLKDLIERHPDRPALYNYLYAAYNLMGDEEKAREVLMENCRKHPDYLFAKIGDIEQCLREDNLDEIPKILDNRYDLKLLYPHRNKFHITEFVGFAGTIGYYFFRIGKPDLAEHYHKLLKRAAPEDPQTKRLESTLHAYKVMRRLTSLLRP